MPSSAPFTGAPSSAEPPASSAAPAAAETERCAALAAEYLTRWIASRDLPARLARALRYVLEGDGKRLRPVLALHVCRALGGDERVALPAAAALELIHDFSLVHDDLPALDDDDLRRGRATLHRHVDEATAILAGDAMLALATHLVILEVKDATLSRDLANELLAGTVDMISGQVLDTFPDSEAERPERERLARIHRLKTGALIRAACRMGARCAGAGARELADATRFGETLGLMFQVVDDLLDVTQTTEHLGKGAGKDAERGKLTYPGVHGLEGARAEVTRLCTEAQRALASWPREGERGAATRALIELSDRMAVRTR